MSSRAEMVCKAAEMAAIFQAQKVAARVADTGRTAAEIEWDYALTSRCDCHFWEFYRCHVLQGRRPVR